MSDFRVSLDNYNGPLDLLLYLIRRDELDIHDIPIARITEGYCRHVEMLQKIDPDLAGEFLVMAATLLEIKTRLLLPSPPPETDGAAEAFDPRSELVRQLLEYKAFKDAAEDLRLGAQRQSLRFPRHPAEVPADAPPDRDLEDVQVWDLVEAFTKLMTSIGQGPGQRTILYDDTPIDLHAADIVDRLQREGNMTFRQVFAGRSNRAELVGLFLAMLELIRNRRIAVQQEESFGEIFVFLRSQGDSPPAGEATVPAEGAAAPAVAPSVGSPTEAPAGEIAPEAPSAAPVPAGPPQPPPQETATSPAPPSEAADDHSPSP